MSNRQYGIPTGYQEGNQLPPVEAYPSHQLQDYPPSSMQNLSPPRKPVPPPPPPHSTSYGTPQLPPGQFDYAPYTSPMEQSRPAHRYGNSQSSIAPLTTYAAGMPAEQSSPPRGLAAPEGGDLGYAYYDRPQSRQYRGDGYDEYFDPRDIADDGDDGYDHEAAQRRNRGLGAGLGAAAGGAAVLNALKPRDPSGNYGPVGGNNSGGHGEKSEWLHQQRSGNKRLRWIVGAIIAVIVVAAIAGGVAYAVIHRGSGSSAPDVSDIHGFLDLNSPQVQDVMNNKDLHRVFPGMDYTPLNAQYPDCLSNPPDQNNITLDVAVLSQLTPAIRLYGTDCGQTEMVLTAIEKLQMVDSIKVWLGVYLDSNATTNTRQLKQMYSILDKYDSTRFAGVIVGNEVLFREDMTAPELGAQLTKVRSALSARNINLPVATADLGDDWTTALAADSDIVMSNVHPFFAGVTPDKAPAWTWNFWNENDVVLKAPGPSGSYPRNIISETGWPSEGGNDCGGSKCTSKTQGSVAGIDEMNEFMDGFVCQSNAKGYTYFWFEAFDEPWKEQFNDPKTGDYWEPHWGLMDVNRNLKDGLKIPDCGGKTINSAY